MLRRSAGPQFEVCNWTGNPDQLAHYQREEENYGCRAHLSEHAVSCLDKYSENVLLYLCNPPEWPNLDPLVAT